MRGGSGCLGLLVAGAALLVSRTAFGEEGAWYDDEECIAGVRAAFAGDLEESERLLGAMRSRISSHNEACAVWLRVVHTELGRILSPNVDVPEEKRVRELARLRRFADRHRDQLALADLGLEAELWRLKLMVDRGETLAAESPARRLWSAVRARQKQGPPRPTLLLVEATSGAASAYASFPIRMLMSLINLSAERETVDQNLDQLVSTRNAYQPIALLIAYRCAREAGDRKRTCRFGKELSAAFPRNQVFAEQRREDVKRHGCR